MPGEEWTVGDHVEVDRIPTQLTGRNRSWLQIYAFDGDEDDPNPIVQLLYKELDGQKLAREMFHHVRMSDLREAGSKVRVPAGQRAVLGLEPVPCACHCGENTSGAQFKQGHDARLKGALQRWANDRPPKLTETDNWVRGNMSQADAKTELLKRGWPPGRS
jgi:hypothetical protein